MNREYRKWSGWVVGSIIMVVLVVALWWLSSDSSSMMLNPLGDKKEEAREKPYEKYSFERLVEREDKPSVIELGRELSSEDAFTSYVYYYTSEGRRISGQMNRPTRCNIEGCPVIVMARGYVDKEIYTIGMGTKNAAAVYARNGYITLAPDFSGYGESSQEDENALGARLVKPVEVLDLIASVRADDNLALHGSDTPIYLWGHSNGGQIMLSVAEILGSRKSINPSSLESVKGVTLWAPVSKPFPYNILYYTDELSDHGKWLRGEIAKFEEDYDVYNYSIDRYLDWITIPILVHQGGRDDAVPQKWSDQLVESLKSKDKSVTYYPYPGADHNMRPVWDTVVARDLEWYQSL